MGNNVTTVSYCNMQRIKIDSKNSFIDYFSSISLVLCFFLSQYISFIPGVTIGELVLIFSSIMLVLKHSCVFKNKTSQYILLFYLLCLILTISSILSAKISFDMVSKMEVISRWIRYFSYVLISVLYLENFTKKDLIKRIYRFVVILVSIYAIIQFLFYIFFKVMLPVNILPFKMEHNIDSEAISSVTTQRGFRAYGIFTEPSYLAKFLFPGLLFSLIGWNKKHVYFFDSVLIIVAILLSASLQGYIVLFVSLLCFVFSKNNGIKPLSRTILIVLLIAFVLVLLTNNGIFGAVLSRFTRFINGGSDYSSSLRVYRGFAIWFLLPIIYKIIGVGMGNASNYVSTFDLHTSYDYFITNETTLEYMSGLSKLLVENGLIMFIICLLGLAILFKKSNIFGRLVLIQFVLILLSGSSLFSVLSVMYFLFIVLLGDRKKWKSTIVL